MPIQVLANGTPRFHYRKDEVTIGDIYDAADVYSFITSPPTSIKGALKDKAKDAITVDPMEIALEGLGQITGAHILDLGVAFMLLRMSPIQVFIALRQEHTLWPTTSRNVTMRMSTDEGCGTRELFRRLNPALEDTDMDGYGALAAIGHTFDAFSRRGGKAHDGSIRLMIELSQ